MTATVTETTPFGIAIPAGRRIELPGRGVTFVREAPGPPGAPTVVLLHGWMANSALNWFTAYGALARRWRVVAVDHRGHGRGIRTRRRFRLADCADDVAALCERLGVERVVPVGYSMGGPVAQLLWHRHRDLVAGVVLCATARDFAGRAPGRFALGAMGPMAAMTRVVPPVVRRSVARAVFAQVGDGPVARWVRDEIGRNDPRMVLEAGAELARFTSREWIGDLDVPACVVITRLDRLVPAGRQWKLAASIPGASVVEIPADHGACVARPDVFVPALVSALDDVTRRAGLA